MERSVNPDASGELQDFALNGRPLEWYDYGFRYYDPTIGRFHSVDLLAEYYLRQTSYAYALNNPMRYIDFLGLAPDQYEGINSDSFSRKKKEGKVLPKDPNTGIIDAGTQLPTIVKLSPWQRFKRWLKKPYEGGLYMESSIGQGTSVKGKKPHYIGSIDGMMVLARGAKAGQITGPSDNPPVDWVEAITKIFEILGLVEEKNDRATMKESAGNNVELIEKEVERRSAILEKSNDPALELNEPTFEKGDTVKCNTCSDTYIWDGSGRYHGSGKVPSIPSRNYPKDPNQKK